MLRTAMTSPRPDPEDDSSGEHSYTVAEASQLFGLPQQRLRYWSQTGFLPASSRLGGRLRYTFRDLIAIKVAKELLDAGVPPRRVRRSLDALRVNLPHQSSLSHLRIRCEDDKVVVVERDRRFEAASGQLLLDLEVETFTQHVENVLMLPWADGSRAPAAQRSAYEWFLYGNELDRRDPGVRAQAREAYEQAVALDPELAAAWTNLGGLLAEDGDWTGARDMFEEALRCDPDQPEAQVNLAELALRDGDPEVAIAGFRQVLRLAPDYFEAHYGLARALLQVGGKGQAVAHLERFCKAVDALDGQGIDAGLQARWAYARRTVAHLRGLLSSGGE